MKKIKSTIDNLLNKKNRKNNSGRYKTYNVSTLDDLVDELDNPAKQERVLANQVKKKKYEKWCLTFGYDIQQTDRYIFLEFYCVPGIIPNYGIYLALLFY